MSLDRPLRAGRRERAPLTGHAREGALVETNGGLLLVFARVDACMHDDERSERDERGDDAHPRSLGHRLDEDDGGEDRDRDEEHDETRARDAAGLLLEVGELFTSRGERGLVGFFRASHLAHADNTIVIA
jgi:hypothetical protein